jgi:predicted metalloprotease
LARTYKKEGNLYKDLSNNNMNFDNLNDLSLNKIDELQDDIEESLVKQSCEDSPYNCVLIEEIKNNVTSFSKIKENSNEFSYYCFQIYSVLDTLKDKFVHHDLHRDNVLIYYPGGTGKNKNKDKYITMNYHYPDKSIVSFKTFGIAKIIDYGRSYFYNDDKLNSKIIHNFLQNKSECGYDVIIYTIIDFNQFKDLSLIYGFDKKGNADLRNNKERPIRIISDAHKNYKIIISNNELKKITNDEKNNLSLSNSFVEFINNLLNDENKKNELIEFISILNKYQESFNDYKELGVMNIYLNKSNKMTFELTEST